MVVILGGFVPSANQKCRHISLKMISLNVSHIALEKQNMRVAQIRYLPL